MKHHTKTCSIPNIISMAEVNNDQESQTARIKASISEDIASLFTRYFASVFESDDAVIDTSNELEALVLSEIILTVEEVQAVLETLDVTKDTGPDNVRARLLKERASVISVSLCSLFNKSLRQGALPENCQYSFCVQKSEKEHAGNYRPISLLSIVSNVLERCVLNDVWSQLYQVITASQHGFTRARSCVTNLLEVTNHISSVLDVGDQVDAAYLDMSKAFDKVNHNILLLTLRKAGFAFCMTNFF